MSASSQRSPRLSRAATVRRNDEALRSAVAAIIVESGWDSLSFSTVAKRAGLTVGAIYNRAENQADLGIDLWEHETGPWLNEAVTDLIGAATSGDPTSMSEKFRAWDASSGRTAAVTELLIASLFDHDLAEVVLADARQALGRLCTPSEREPKVTRQAAAGSALVLSFALGRALATRGHPTLPELSRGQLEVLSRHACAPAYRGRVPAAPELTWTRDTSHVDPSAAALTAGTLSTIGRVGFRRATVSRIARASGIPRGSVLSHFDDKVSLVSHAAHLGLIPPGEVWAQYAPVVEEHGPLISRAMFLKDFLKPENAPLWALNLELARLANVEPRLGEFRVSANTLEHTHLGVMLLASIVPGLDELPYAGAFMAGSAT